MKKCSKKILRLLWLFFPCCYLLLAGCLAITQTPQPQAGFTEYYAHTAQEYLALAAKAKPPEKQAYQLKAVGRLIQEQHYTEAERLLSHIDAHNELANEKILLQTNLLLAQQQTQQALIELNTIEQIESLTQAQKLAYYQSSSRANRQLGDYLLSAEATLSMEPFLVNDYQRQHNQQEIWSDLNQLSTDALSTQIRHIGYGELQGWLEAAYVNKAYSTQPDLLQQALLQWQQRYPQHPAQDLLPTVSYQRTNDTETLTTHTKKILNPLNNNSMPPKVALLLPMSGSLGESGEAIRSGFMAAYYDSNRQQSPQTIQIYNTDQGNAATLYKQAIANGANLVIGPLIKNDVVSLERMGSLAVPTIALNYTTAKQKPNRNLYEYALSPQDEARQVAQKTRRDGYSHALVIAPAGDWGEGIADHYIRGWEATGATIVEKFFYTDSSDLNKTIKELLQINSSHSRQQKLKSILGENIAATPQKRTDVDVIFLVSSPAKARQIIPLLKFYYAGDIPIYSTSMIYSGVPDPLHDKDLNGVIFCEIPWLIDNSYTLQKQREKMRALFPQAKPQTVRLYAFGMDAYQLAITLYYTGLTAHASLDGTTGQLYVGEPQQQIYRRLDWAQFKEGVPRKL
jgi:uncharacterized protein